MRPERETGLTGRVESVVRLVTGRASGDLDLDSLGTADLVLALEEELELTLGDAGPRTVEEAVEARRAAARGGGGAGLAPGIGHLQWLAEAVTGRVLSSCFRLDVEGSEHVPSSGPVVLASNHDSLLDIPFLVLASPRRVWFMAKRELSGTRSRDFLPFLPGRRGWRWPPVRR